MDFFNKTVAKVIILVIIAISAALFLIVSGLKVNSDENAVQLEQKIGPATSDTNVQSQDQAAK